MFDEGIFVSTAKEMNEMVCYHVERRCAGGRPESMPCKCFFGQCSAKDVAIFTNYDNSTNHSYESKYLKVLETSLFHISCPGFNSVLLK